MRIEDIDLSSELEFLSSRSSGKGGQHVNKVATKITLRFHVKNSNLLSDKQKSRISKKLTARINKDGFLTINSQAKSSQALNKKLAINRFYRLIQNALKVKKKRIPTKPTKASQIKRLKQKKIISMKKVSRATKSDNEAE